MENLEQISDELSATEVAEIERSYAQKVLDERRRQLIGVLTWSMFALLITGLVFVVGAFIWPYAPAPKPAVLLVFAVGLGVSGAILYLIRRRRTLLAGTLLVYMFFLIIAGSIFISPGPQGAGTGDLRFAAFFYLTVLWAGLLIGPRSAFAVATLACGVISINIAVEYSPLAHGHLGGYLNQLVQAEVLEFAVYYGIAFATWFFSTAIQRQLSARAVSLAQSNLIIRKEARLRSETSATVQALSERLATAAAQQLGALQEQAQAIKNVNRMIEGLGGEAEEMARLAESVVQYAINVQQETMRGQQIIGNALEALEQAEQSVQEITQRMQALAGRVTITEVVTRQMARIAGEVQLLALNAMIEAAGARAAGTRFGVVAVEVNRLASEAQKSSEQARQLLSEVYLASQEAVTATEQGQSIAEASAVIAEQAAAANTQIGQMVDKVTTQVEAIGGSTNQQRSASRQVVQIMHELAGVVTETERASRETAAAAVELRLLAHDLLPTPS